MLGICFLDEGYAGDGLGAYLKYKNAKAHHRFERLRLSRAVLIVPIPA